jgi:hypothetical protein
LKGIKNFARKLFFLKLRLWETGEKYNFSPGGKCHFFSWNKKACGKILENCGKLTTFILVGAFFFFLIKLT